MKRDTKIKLDRLINVGELNFTFRKMNDQYYLFAKLIPFGKTFCGEIDKKERDYKKSLNVMRPISPGSRMIFWRIVEDAIWMIEEMYLNPEKFEENIK